MTQAANGPKRLPPLNGSRSDVLPIGVDGNLSMTTRSGKGEQVISAVFFDVGETIVDESREYGTWADWLGVPRYTFSAVFGAVIACAGDYRDTFRVFRPGFDLAEQRQRRAAAGKPETFAEQNLYPDARPCLQALRD